MIQITHHTVATPPQRKHLAVLEGTPDFGATLRAALADRYTIEREIGRGGMSVVFLAKDLKHDRQVALKVLRPELTAALPVGRFFREIEISSRLDHPNILGLYESGEADGRPYFAMPFVKGESLRQRLNREYQLSIDDTLRISRDVAEALEYAHAHGVVHRDIKPENILLDGTHTYVADFGIARAVTEAGGDTLTSSGQVIGTPEYMSPEQGSITGRVDYRSDIYSLGCVVYEMLGGEPPFTGPSSQAIVARQMHEAPRSLRVIRSTVPEEMQAALEVALAKVPADRFSGAVEFVEALAGDTRQMPVMWHVSRMRKWILGAGIVAAAGLALWVRANSPGGLLGNAAPPDTTAYAVLPFVYQAGIPSLNETQLLRDALGRWSRVNVVDAFKVREAMGRRDSSLLTPTDVVRIARRSGAGRFLRGQVSRLGDSIRVSIGLNDVARDTLLAERAVRLPQSLKGGDSALVLATDRLLLRGAVPDGVRLYAGTRSLPARQGFAAGLRALDDWDLARADQAFTTAVADTILGDKDYAEAHLWVGLTRAWRGAKAGDWQLEARQAANDSTMLSRRDRGLLAAVLAQAEDFGRACPLWQRMTRADSTDFVAWYGAAYCMANDLVVLPEVHSASGWRFRTSHYQALLAYKQAFQRHPAILKSFRTDYYTTLSKVFKVNGNGRILGRALPPDTTAFSAEPAWRGDSLAYVPYTRARARALRSTAPPLEKQEAFRHLRGWVRDVATAWVAVDRDNADALETLALSLAMVGEPAGLETLMRARARVTDPVEALRMSGEEVWMNLAFGIPSSHDRVHRAKEIADSLLRDTPAQSGNPVLMAGLAALTGRARLAAGFFRDARGAEIFKGGDSIVPAGAPEFLMYAALGWPGESLAVLERTVGATIIGTFPPADQESAQLQWVARAATLAYPGYQSESIDRLAGKGDYLVDLQAAHSRGRAAAVRHDLRVLHDSTRRGLLAWNLTIDALYPEAGLLVALGDLPYAAAWLDPTLHALPQVAPETMSSPIRAASLVRALGLRARIARQLGRPDEARMWAWLVLELWFDADPLLKEQVQDLRSLVN